MDFMPVVLLRVGKIKNLDLSVKSAKQQILKGSARLVFIWWTEAQRRWMTSKFHLLNFIVLLV